MTQPVVLHRNIHAHDEKETCVVGDIVRINHGIKRSTMKSFELSDIIKPANRYTDPETNILHTQASSEYDEKDVAWKNSTKENGFNLKWPVN